MEIAINVFLSYEDRVFLRNKTCHLQIMADFVLNFAHFTSVSQSSKARALDEEELNFKVLNDIEFIKYLSIRGVIYP